MTGDDAQLANDFVTLTRYLGDTNLTARLAEIEYALLDQQADDAAASVADRGCSDDLLSAALTVRKHVGRINDVIHAAASTLTLPQILEPGEKVITRPSLGAGNDPSRPFDLETDRRIAEFKVAQWKGADTMRKRGTFVDLVHLALDTSERRAQLFTVGTLPSHFLRGSAATAGWAMGRASPHTRARFEAAFGPADQITIAEFTAGPAAHIELVDLTKYLPALAV